MDFSEPGFSGGNYGIYGKGKTADGASALCPPFSLPGFGKGIAVSLKILCDFFVFPGRILCEGRLRQAAFIYAFRHGAHRLLVSCFFHTLFPFRPKGSDAPD